MLPGFNDAHVHFISGGLSLERIDLDWRGHARRDSVADTDVGSQSTPTRRGCIGTRVVLPAVRRRPADPAAARRDRLRSAGANHQPRRPHVVGEHPGAAPGRDHEENAQSRRTASSSRTRKPASRPASLKEAAMALVSSHLPQATRTDRASRASRGDRRSAAQRHHQRAERRAATPRTSSSTPRRGARATSGSASIPRCRRRAC